MIPRMVWRKWRVREIPTPYHGGKKFQRIVGYSALELTWQVVAICFSYESKDSNADGAVVVPPDMSGTTIYYIIY